jgi:hypothetical protein
VLFVEVPYPKPQTLRLRMIALDSLKTELLLSGCKIKASTSLKSARSEAEQYERSHVPRERKHDGKPVAFAVFRKGRPAFLLTRWKGE